MDSIVYGGVEGREYVSIEAFASVYRRPADLVSGGARAGSSTLGCSVPEAEEVRARHEPAGRRGEGVRAVPICVARRLGSGTRGGACSREVPVVEVPQTDQLPAKRAVRWGMSERSNG